MKANCPESRFRDLEAFAVDGGRILLLTDGLWHGAIFALERPSVISLQLSNCHETSPFFVTSGPAWAYLLWVAAWFVVVHGAGLLSFQAREL